MKIDHIQSEPPMNDPIWQRQKNGWYIPQVCRHYEYALTLLKSGYCLREYIDVEKTFIINNENSLPITDKVLLKLFKAHSFSTMYRQDEMDTEMKTIRHFYLKNNEQNN